MPKLELFNDHFQNFKRYNIPKAQLVIADIPYNLANKAYASNPQWYVDGQISEGQSEVAGKQFFDTDKEFRISEFMEFTATFVQFSTLVFASGAPAEGSGTTLSGSPGSKETE